MEVPIGARRTPKLRQALPGGGIAGSAFLFLGAVPDKEGEAFEEHDKTAVLLLPGPSV